MHLVVLALKLLQPRVEVRADAGEDVAQVRQHGLGEERYLVTKTKWACMAKTQCLPRRNSLGSLIDR